MKKLLFIFMFFAATIFAQTGPWQAPLLMCTSANGTTFGTATMFQDSSGVPTVIRLGSATSDTLMAAFQWFPAPKFSTYWDKIAVKFSYNGGTTWTSPTSCTFTGLPVGFQRPFDPGLVQLSSGQIRMYFSDGVNSPPAGGIDTYSGISNDGITYTFEPVAKFDDPTKNAIDPTVAYFSGTYFYNAWSGNTTDGAYRATSNNGVTFTTQPVSSYDGSHLWLGNYLNDGSFLKFYGCGSNIWVNSSSNGTTWNTYTVTNVGMGADPAVVKNKAGTYIMLYTGPPAVAGINDSGQINQSVKIFPNVFSHHFNVTNSSDENLKVELFDVCGKLVFSSVYEKNIRDFKINLSHLAGGTYNCVITGDKLIVRRKLIKTD